MLARLALIALVPLLLSCGADDTRTRLSIATGGTGGVYFVYGGALARVLSARVPGVEATAEVTAASAENLQFVADHSADLAFTLADSAADAVAGRGVFEGQRVPLRTLAVLYRNATHIVVPATAPIKSVADLAGRRVSTGAPNSGTELVAARLLEVAGVADVRRERLSVAESASALRDGRLDAFFWSGGVPTAAVLDLAASPGAAIRLLSHADLVPALVARHGALYETWNLPADAYPGTPAADVSAVWNLLVVHERMDDELAYRLTKALFDGRADLAAAHPAARELDPAVASRPVGGLAHHPGAVRYFREVLGNR